MNLNQSFHFYNYIKKRFNYRQELVSDLGLIASDVQFFFDDKKVRIRVNAAHHIFSKIQNRF